MKRSFGILLLGLCLGACQSGPAYVGSWTSDKEGSGTMPGAKMELVLNADKSYQMTADMGANGTSMKIVDTGTYEVTEPDKMKFTVADMKWEIKTDNAAQKAQAEAMMNQGKAEIIKQRNAAPASTYSIKDGNLVTSDSQSGEIVWKRKK